MCEKNPIQSHETFCILVSLRLSYRLSNFKKMDSETENGNIEFIPAPTGKVCFSPKLLSRSL